MASPWPWSRRPIPEPEAGSGGFGQGAGEVRGGRGGRGRPALAQAARRQFQLFRGQEEAVATGERPHLNPRAEERDGRRRQQGQDDRQEDQGQVRARQEGGGEDHPGADLPGVSGEA